METENSYGFDRVDMLCLEQAQNKGLAIYNSDENQRAIKSL